MTGASPGDPEDLLGQFLAHRASPAGTPPAERPDEQQETPPPQADETDVATSDAADAATSDEALEESIDGQVYELVDAPLDFAEPDTAPEPEQAPDPGPEPRVAETIAHAGAVLEAFASGTLDVAPDAELDPAVGNDAYELEPGVEDIDPIAPSAVVDPSASPPATARDLEPSAAAPDEAAAFEELAVSSPLTREPPAAPGHRGTARPDEVDERPDATAASATVFAAFQEQLARQEPAPDPAPELVDLVELVEPVEPAEPAEPAEPEPEAPLPIVPPVARAEPLRPARRRAARAEPKVTAPRLPATTPAPVAEPAPPAVPNEVVFKPRRMARALVALILVVFVAASAVACWWAYRERTLVPVGIAATVLIATGIVWATRAGSTVAHLSVRGGRLEITKDGTRTVFDLSSQYTDVQVHGTPGRRNWRVMFGRRGLPPYVIDSSMVSPAEFMRVLEYYRPEQDR